MCLPSHCASLLPSVLLLLLLSQVESLTQLPACLPASLPPCLPLLLAATVKVLGASQPDWAFHLHELGGGHWVSVARAPLAAVVDAWGVSAGQGAGRSAGVCWVRAVA